MHHFFTIASITEIDHFNQISYSKLMKTKQHPILTKHISSYNLYNSNTHKNQTFSVLRNHLYLQSKIITSLILDFVLLREFLQK